MMPNQSSEPTAVALSVPPSRFTSRVGGGSAFYVRRCSVYEKMLATRPHRCRSVAGSTWFCYGGVRCRSYRYGALLSWLGSLFDRLRYWYRSFCYSTACRASFPLRTRSSGSRCLRRSQVLLFACLRSRSTGASLRPVDGSTQTLYGTSVLCRQRGRVFLLPSWCRFSRPLQGADRQDKSPPHISIGHGGALSCDGRDGSLLTETPNMRIGCTASLRNYSALA